MWSRSNSFIKASSVPLLPCPRIRDMTSERFALVKTSGIGAFQGKSGQLATPLGFVGRVGFHLVVEAGPLSVGRIEFIVIEIASISAPPRFGGKATQEIGRAHV